MTFAARVLHRQAPAATAVAACAPSRTADSRSVPRPALSLVRGWKGTVPVNQTEGQALIERTAALFGADTITVVEPSTHRNDCHHGACTCTYLGTQGAWVSVDTAALFEAVADLWSSAGLDVDRPADAGDGVSDMTGRSATGAWMRLSVSGNRVAVDGETDHLPA